MIKDVDTCLVVWIPDANLLEMTGGTSGASSQTADQTLTSLEAFMPEVWGLPPYDNSMLSK